MRYEKQILIAILQLIATKKIDLQTFPIRLKKNQITQKDKVFLSHLGGCLSSLFGASSVFQNNASNAAVVLSSFEAELNKYEEHISGDTLAARFQPHIDALLHKLTHVEKNRLLKNIEAICEVLADNETIAHLSLLWGYIQAVDIESRSVDKKNEKSFSTTIEKDLTTQPLQSSLKNKAYQYLITYKTHLYSELKRAWPYTYAIATTKEGRVFLLNAKGQSIKEANMPLDLRLLTQKCRAVNEAIIFVKTKKTSFTEFKRHFETKTRAIIEQIRSPSDNAILNFMARLFSHPLGFFAKTYATKGGQVAKAIEKMSDSFSSQNTHFKQG